MTLHDAVERVLLEAGRSMTTSEIAEHVNARGLYTKRDGSPVSAFQIHGRTRKYPRLFTQAGSTISLAQWGDSSPRRSTTASALGEAPASLPAVVPPPPSIDSSQLEAPLFNPIAFRLAGTIDLEVADRPGLYAVRVRDKNALPEPFKSLSERRSHDLLYVGIASASLRRRLVGQELRARGHGSFFRSIGAILGYRPLAGSLIGKANTSNYKFAPADNREIIDWINENLLVNWVEFSGAHALEESMLIRKHLPLLNLQGNPAALPELSGLRAECVRIANTDSA